MLMTRRTVASVVAMVGLLAFSGSAWAQTAAEQRAAQRQQTEKQLARLHEKVAAAQPANPSAEAHTKVANRMLDMAQKALDVNNERIAKLLADQADQALTLAAKAKGVQQ
jgi:uncharacterized protein (DUF58 family)